MSKQESEKVSPMSPIDRKTVGNLEVLLEKVVVAEDALLMTNQLKQKLCQLLKFKEHVCKAEQAYQQ